MNYQATIRDEKLKNRIATQASHDNMTPEAWTNYTDRVRATHWFERFPDGDGRRLLTWKGRFCNVTNIVNFYSTQEEVVCGIVPQARERLWIAIARHSASPRLSPRYARPSP